MRAQREVNYQYWTGTQWVPQSIPIGDSLSTGWHILHMVLCLLTLGLWLPVYLLHYFADQADLKARTETAQRSVNLYYAQLEEQRKASV